MAKREAEKMRNLNKFNEIVGIANMSLEKTLEYLKSNNITNMTIMIDSHDEFKNLNNLPTKFEMVTLENKILEFNKDPTVGNLIKNGLICFFMLIIFVLNSYYNCKDLFNFSYYEIPNRLSYNKCL